MEHLANTEGIELYDMKQLESELVHKLKEKHRSKNHSKTKGFSLTQDLCERQTHPALKEFIRSKKTASFSVT